MNEKKYISGFNAGYFLKRYHPELFDKLSKTMETDNDYLSGFKDGADQRSTEETKHSPEHFEEIDIDKDLSQSRTQDKSKDKDFDK